MLIDVTRLADRALKERLPTGVDRVGLAYVAHFRERAAALVRYAGRWLVAGPGDSARIFDALVDQGPRTAKALRLAVGRSYLVPWGARPAGRLLNTGHSGLDDPAYAREIRRRGWSAFFFFA